MSWSASFLVPVLKGAASPALDELPKPESGPMLDQFQVAKTAVRVLLPNIAGPFIHVSMSGHANSVGWQKKEGWSDDFINIVVTQHTEAPDGR